MLNIKKYFMADDGTGANGSETADTTTSTETNTETGTVQQSVNAEGEGATTSQQIEKPVQTNEENAAYAKARREYEQRLSQETQKAKDQFISSQGYVWNGKAITTEAEYTQALQEQAEQQRQEQLRQQGIDPKIVEDYIQNNPAVKWANEFKSKQEQEQAQQQQFLDFMNAYPDVKPDEVPPEVWQEVNKGIPLKIAYAMAENTKLKTELEEYKKGSKTNQVNQVNAQNSTGSLTGQGNLPAGFITKDVFDANKKDQSWLNNNYDLLKQSMNLWK